MDQLPDEGERLRSADVVGIDEAQFFEPAIVDAALALADGGAVLSVPADLWGATRCSRVYGDVRLELPEDPGSVAGAAALY